MLSKTGIYLKLTKYIVLAPSWFFLLKTLNIKTQNTIHLNFSKMSAITNILNGTNWTPKLLMCFEMLVSNFKNNEFGYTKPKFQLNMHSLNF